MAVEVAEEEEEGRASGLGLEGEVNVLSLGSRASERASVASAPERVAQVASCMLPVDVKCMLLSEAEATAFGCGGEAGDEWRWRR